MTHKLLFYGFRHGHVNAFYQKVAESPLFDCFGCVEENESARKSAEQALGAHFEDKSYDEWLTEKFDAVVIGCAYGERGAAIIKALEAGKHVIADKPICTKKEELDRIRTLAREKNLTVHCMLDLRYLPQSVRACELLASKRLGEVRSVAFNGQHCLDLGNRPAWYFEEGMHGGTINDLAVHGVDLVRILTGLEFAEIDAARTWNAYDTVHPNFEDSAVFMARLSNGASVLADISYSSPKVPYLLPSYWEFRIFCERGMLSFDYAEPTVSVFEEGSAAPEILDGHAPALSVLEEFSAAIASRDLAVTESVLASSESVLKIQAEADRT